MVVAMKSSATTVHRYPNRRSPARSGTRESLPQSLEIRRPERAVVQAVAWSTALAPDHSSMIGAHRTGESRLAQRGEHGRHVHVAEARWMRHLLEALRPRDPDVATMGEVDTFHPGELHRNCDVVVVMTQHT